MRFSMIWLLLAMAQGAQLPGMNVVEPAQTNDARVVLTFDKPAFTLGEPVLLHFCLENVSSKPFSIEIGGDYRGGSRSSRFKVIVMNATGSVVPDPDPGGFNLGGISSVPEVAPGQRHCQSIPLMRYARVDASGTYSIRATHDLGWTATKAPQGQTTITLRMPSAEEAGRIVATTLAQPNEAEYLASGGGGLRIVKPRRDFSLLRYPIYLAPLVGLVEAGNSEALVGIGAIPTPEATRALIGLMSHRDPILARDASRQLASRLPDPALEGRLPRRGPFSNDLEDPRRYLRDASWRSEFAAEVRSIAGQWLASDDATRVIQAAFMMEAVGTISDVPALSGALDRALERTLTLPFEKGGYPRPRGAMQELMRATDVMISIGYAPPASPATPGDAVLWLAAFGKGARPENWQATMRTLLEHRIPYLRELALQRLPDAAPAELVAAVGPALQHPDVDVQVAALDAVKRLKLVGHAPQVAAMCKSASDTMFLSFACNALHATGGRVAVMEIMAARLTEKNAFNDSISRLFGILQHSGAGGGDTLTPEAKADLAQRWQTFIRAHRAEIDAGKQFALDDPAVAGLVPPGWTLTPLRK